MESIIINIKDRQLADKILWLLEHFQEDGLEIISQEDWDDLQLLKATRSETTIPFDDYLEAEGIEN
ncbi:MAG TPA: hypothetical protein EYP41_02615 [Anaerolineae bacterium]|nr:hypothetical protein [Anaerolineae bacterium]HIP71951.1 hypothetical protein [Anaerolineae bacterium]